MERIKNYGFSVPKIDKTNYISGDGRLLGASFLNPSGDWSACLPKYEPQAENYETWGCTVWGLQNQVEILHKYLYEEEPNFDERFNYNLAKILPPGTDPQIAYETARRNGLIEGFLLAVPTLQEFATPRPMIEPYLSAGKAWKEKYHFDHDWVLTGQPNPEKLRYYLKQSPIAMSVTAWFEENGVFVDRGIPNNHWCVLYKMDDEFYYVFDSYDHSEKKLPLSHNISYAKRIVLYKKTGKSNWILDIIVSIIRGIVRFVRR